MHLADCLLLLLAGLLFLSQGQRHPEHHGQGHIHCPHQEAPGTGEGSPSLKVTAGNTAFALRFYHLMASQPYGSNVFSLLSISTAYAMLSLGVRSHSRTQILEGLGFNLTEVSVSDIHGGFQNLLHTLHLPADRLEIRVGSALLLSLELPLLLRFLNDSVTFYESKLFHTNFDDSEGTTQLINNNVREESRGKIVDLVNELSVDTMMVLVNYIYFKALWEKPSIPLMTAPHDFYVDEDTIVKVLMLQDTQHHWYLHDRYLPPVLRMDYKGNVTALFILPNGKMEQVEGALTPEMLTRRSNLLRKRKLKLYIPQFSISGSYKFDILPKVGIMDLFSRADLSGITELNLQVSKSFHKAILEVDEIGTQAAAATSGFVTFWSRDNHQALWFNRPFLVVIFSTNTQSIHFLGKVVHPTKP
ncbi:LOW QUALITY PROTEIN: kallistatin [Megaptera novaeangliae]